MSDKSPEHEDQQHAPLVLLPTPRAPAPTPADENYEWPEDAARGIVIQSENASASAQQQQSASLEYGKGLTGLEAQRELEISLEEYSEDSKPSVGDEDIQEPIDLPETDEDEQKTPTSTPSSGRRPVHVVFPPEIPPATDPLPGFEEKGDLTLSRPAKAAAPKYIHIPEYLGKVRQMSFDNHYTVLLFFALSNTTFF